jgi:hypothetical protein
MSSALQRLRAEEAPQISSSSAAAPRKFFLGSTEQSDHEEKVRTPLFTPLVLATAPRLQSNAGVTR